MNQQQALAHAQKKANETQRDQIVFKNGQHDEVYRPGYDYCSAEWYYDNPFAQIDEQDYICTVSPAPTLTPADQDNITNWLQSLIQIPTTHARQ